MKIAESWRNDVFMKSSIVLIIVAIIIIFSFLFFILPPTDISLKKPDESITNSSAGLSVTYYGMNKLPIEAKREIYNYSSKYNFTIDKWAFDPVNPNQIDLYAHGFWNESATSVLQGQKIGNYTIHIIHDTDFETTRSEVRGYLMDLQKKPEYQIAYISMTTDSSVDPTAHIAEVAVFGMTPDNEKLNNQVVKGWKIEVGVISSIPSTTSTLSTGDSVK